MEKNKIYVINEKKAVSETLNGETIIINLENGNYYSLNETASILWDGIKNSHEILQIINHLINVYDAGEEKISTSVAKAINFLVGENLIKETTGTASESAVKIEDVKRPFIELEIKRYEDLQEILLADPIHDVDDLGWPILKEKS